MDKPILTEGQQRVRASFNPSSLSKVNKAKALFAEAIDLLSEDEDEVRQNYIDSVDALKYTELSGDFKREIATAKTQIQQASMWAVAALTNAIHFRD